MTEQDGSSRHGVQRPSRPASLPHHDEFVDRFDEDVRDDVSFDEDETAGDDTVGNDKDVTA